MRLYRHSIIGFEHCKAMIKRIRGTVHRNLIAFQETPLCILVYICEEICISFFSYYCQRSLNFVVVFFLNFQHLRSHFKKVEI